MTIKYDTFRNFLVKEGVIEYAESNIELKEQDLEEMFLRWKWRDKKHYLNQARESSWQQTLQSFRTLKESESQEGESLEVDETTQHVIDNYMDFEHWCTEQWRGAIEYNEKVKKITQTYKETYRL